MSLAFQEEKEELVLLNCAFFGSERQISICNELPTEVGEVGTMTAF